MIVIYIILIIFSIINVIAFITSLSKKCHEHLKYYEHLQNLPSFNLKQMDGSYINNKKWEVNEQEELFKYLKPTDKILQLGGNIGASCILADKIGCKKNVCVEPNPKVAKFLKDNKKLTNSKFKIIEGVITDSKRNIYMELPNNTNNNQWGIQTGTSGNFKCNKFKLKDIEKDGEFNVLFADCEGCLPEFLKEYKDHKWELIIFEKDNANNVDYSIVETIAKRNNLQKIKDGFITVFKSNYR